MINATQLAIGETTVRQRDGLFSLNDLHRASGGEKRHQPGYFLANDQTKALVGEISTTGIPAVATVNGGPTRGTYACRELVIAYAAWISAAFHLKVIRVFLASQAEAPQATAGQTLLGTTIGTDGFHCLAALLDGKLRHLPAPERKRAKMHVWSQVHKAFSVVSGEHIPSEQLDSARNFIAAYNVREGEYLGKEQQHPGTVFNDYQLYDVYFICLHFDHLFEIFERYKLYTHLTALGCRAAVEMIDHFRDGSMGTRKLKKDFDAEFDAVQRRLKLNQYR